MKTIIIADEDSSVRNLVRLIFTEDMGYRVVSASSGTDAVLEALEIKPDVVLADISLPGKNGYEVSKEIKNNPFLKNTSVLLLAPSSDALDEKMFIEVRADDFIVKPFESETIIEKLQFFTAFERERVPTLSGRLLEMRKPSSYSIAGLLAIFILITAVMYQTLSRNPPETELKTAGDVKKKEIISEIKEEEIKTSEFTGNEVSFLDPILESGYEPAEKVVVTASYRNKREESLRKNWEAEPKMQFSRQKEAQDGKSNQNEYVVKKGDTLWRIAAGFHTSIGKIKALNKLEGSKIDVGDVLAIPFGNKEEKLEVVGAEEVVVFAVGPGEKFTIQVGAFQKEELAQITIRSLMSKGYPVFVKTVEVPGEGIWHKVRVGTFQSREEARLYADNLKSREPLIKEAIISN